MSIRFVSLAIFHSFRRSRCLRPAALTRWRSAGWGGGSKIDGSGAGGTAREAPALARAGTGRTWRATRSCRLCFGNERAGALGVPPVAAATTGNARPWPLIIRGRFYRLRSVKWVWWQLPPPRKFAGSAGVKRAPHAVIPLGFRYQRPRARQRVERSEEHTSEHQ